MPKIDPRDPRHKVSTLTLPPGKSQVPLNMLMQPSFVIGCYTKPPQFRYYPVAKEMTTYGVVLRKFHDGEWRDAVAVKSTAGPVMVIFRGALHRVADRQKLVDASMSDPVAVDDQSVWVLDNQGIVVFMTEDDMVKGMERKFGVPKPGIILP